MPQSKRCSKCGSDKTYFYKKRNYFKWSYDEDNNIICNKCSSKAWRFANHDYYLNYNKNWYLANRDYLLNYWRNSYLANHDYELNYQNNRHYSMRST